MAVVASRELRNQTRALLKRVESGETLTVAVNGRPVALLAPLPDRPRWITRESFLRLLEGNQADPGMGADLARLSPDTTDDLQL